MLVINVRQYWCVLCIRLGIREIVALDQTCPANKTKFAMVLVEYL